MGTQSLWTHCYYGYFLTVDNIPLWTLSYNYYILFLNVCIFLFLFAHNSGNPLRGLSIKINVDTLLLWTRCYYGHIPTVNTVLLWAHSYCRKFPIVGTLLLWSVDALLLWTLSYYGQSLTIIILYVYMCIFLFLLTRKSDNPLRGLTII